MHYSNAVFPQTTVKIVPGPGTYSYKDAIELNPMGHYHCSNHRNSKAKVFNPPRSKRFYKSSIGLFIQHLMSLALECTILKMIYQTKENMCSLKTYLPGKEGF
jgi:hypothetical protein